VGRDSSKRRLEKAGRQPVPEYYYQRWHGHASLVQQPIPKSRECANPFLPSFCYSSKLDGQPMLHGMIMLNP